MNNRQQLVGLISLAAAFVLCGCESRVSQQNQDSPSSEQQPSSAEVSAPHLPLYDGFESGKLAEFWLPGDYGSGRSKPGAIAITTERARAGAACVKITVHEGDIEQTGSDGLLTERAELDSGKYPMLGRDLWCGFSFLVPTDFPVVDNRLVIYQWKQNDGDGGPLIAQRYRAGHHELTIQTPSSFWSEKKRFTLPDIRPGQWTDVIYHVRFSKMNDGVVEVWFDGKQVVDHRGVTAFQNGEDRFYNKFGLYRDRWKAPMTIYFDEYTLGSSFKEVNPAP